MQLHNIEAKSLTFCHCSKVANSLKFVLKQVKYFIAVLTGIATMGLNGAMALSLCPILV